MIAQLAGVAAVVMIVSLLLTGQFRKYALAKGLLDTPNARSSHAQPTPRGGGVAIVVSTLAAFLALGAWAILPWRVALGLVGTGGIAAAIGYLDDRKQVSLLVRLFGQFAAAGCAVWLLGTTAVAHAVPFHISAMVVVPLVLFYIVWMLNLTNFMDGIDGIASIEVITVCLGAIACLCLSPNSDVPSPERLALLATCAVVAASTAGFLYWNFPPAKIFMGDAGSGFLGVMLAALSLLGAAVQPSLFWSCIILCGVFIVDATVTLFRRVARREKFYEAHRSHAYQHASRTWNHKTVTVAVGIINVAWLLPLAILSARGMQPLVATAIAYIPLIVAAVRFRAGEAE